MKKIFSIFLSVFFLSGLCAQKTDTSFVDLGRTQLKKDFLQTITVKGSDLEKLPFAGLAEAINVWFFGYNTDARSVVFVIDGNMNADVNLYSIHDIEEISLVQNAIAQVNGSTGQQQLVLVTTKKAKEQGRGLQVNAKSALVENGYKNPTVPSGNKSFKNLYHHYEASAYTNSSRLNAGASFDFLHDVLPQNDQGYNHVRTPRHLDRYRLNTYADLKIGRAHVLSGRVNLAKQNRAFEVTIEPVGGSVMHEDQYGTDMQFNGELKLSSDLGSGFSNQLSGSYTGGKLENSINLMFVNPLYTNDFFSERTFNNILARNSFRYQTTAGNWSFSPALNFSFRHIRNNVTETSRIFNGSGGVQLSQSFRYDRGSKFLVTPSVDLSYLSVFNLQAGVLTDPSQKPDRHVFPFASTTLDLLKMINRNTENSWKLYASYASTGYFYDHTYSIGDLSQIQSEPVQLIFTPGPIVPVLPDSSSSAFNLGTGIEFFKKRISFNYNYGERDFIATFAIRLPPPALYGVLLPEVISKTHRFQLGIVAIDKKDMSWRTNLHLNNIYTEFRQPNEIINHNIIGDLNTDKRSWTGGWNNRFAYKNFFLGVDLITAFSKEFQGWSAMQNENLLAVQHAYAGYRFLRGTLENAEIFLTTRNLVQNEWQRYLMDSRKYYGAGFKWVL